MIFVRLGSEADAEHVPEGNEANGVRTYETHRGIHGKRSGNQAEFVPNCPKLSQLSQIISFFEQILYFLP